VAKSTSDIGIENLSLFFNNARNYVHLDWWGENGISLSGVTNSGSSSKAGEA